MISWLGPSSFKRYKIQPQSGIDAARNILFGMGISAAIVAGYMIIAIIDDY